MNLATNRKAHALASQLWGRDAHEELRALASARGYERWSIVPESTAAAIVRDLKAATAAGTELAGEAISGKSTRQQRDKISAIRHSQSWGWAYVRSLMHEYNVSDWLDLTQPQADHLIQRMSQIAKGQRARAAKTPK